MRREQLLSSPRSPGQRRTLAALGAVLALTLVTFLPAAAQDGSSDPRSRREEIQREKAEVAAQLDVLQATDAELEEAYRTLVEKVRQQEARVADAQREVDEAQRIADQLAAEAEETQRQVDQLRDRVRDRAVAAYVNPSGDTDVTDVLLRDDDLNEAERRKAIVDQLAAGDLDSVDEYRAAKDRLARQREAADAAAAEASTKRDELGAELGTLEADRAEKEAAKAELEGRIADFQSHAAGLAAEEQSIEALILALEAPPAPVAAAPAAAGDTSGGSTATTAPGGGSTPTTTPASPPPVAGGFGWPCGGGVNSPYGPRWGGFHSGIDIGCASGAAVGASKGGTVIFTGFNGGYGNLVLVDHGGGVVTAYAHLSSIAVSSGQSVGGGSFLGSVGCTGSCTGPHLHFEVRVNGSTVDPLSYL